MTRLDVLSRATCFDLLRAHHFGRIAVVVDGQPLVFPVNYAVSGTHVVFRTDPGTKLHAADGKRVAFEIDHAEPFTHEGWSVLVVGVAHEEHDLLRHRELEALPIPVWAGGPKSHWIAVDIHAISGRRVTHATGE
jgi:nitroimidazol reductase NimA-like FMN-containing flavoprotein (pyridoxamine 5'-phosphate oxidase superfamily)